MNSITRLILRRVVSGSVTLTPEVLKILKEVSDAGAADPTPAPPEPTRPENKSDHATPPEAQLGFLSPTGRWLCRMSCALLLIAGPVAATAATSSFDAANEAFAQGQYVEAAHAYETIIAQQGYAAPVLFNLANAQQRAGQLGEAILNYERATLLAPNDPDIAANLNAARQKAGIETKKPSPIQTVARALTLNTWFGLAAAAAFLIAVALPLKQLRPQARGVINFGCVMATFALLMAVSALGLCGPDLRRAVVTTPEAVAGVSPVTLAQPVFKLRAGEAVTLQQTHGDFARVRNHAGYEGWVKLREIARVVPPPATLPKS